MARLTIALIALMISETALSGNSVVLGHGISNAYVERLGCVDEGAMNCWFLWELVVDRTVAGPSVHGRIHALTLQHTDAASALVKSVELFVLAPIGKRDPMGATHTILSLSPRYADGTYCVVLDPQQLGIPIKRPQITARPEGSYCFNSALLHDRSALAFDSSVVGVPFYVSASVEAMCKRDNIICPKVYRELARLAEEPRDNDWASETEANLQTQIESQGPDKYSIRNIECRTSVCAVEVSSLFGPYFGLGYYYDVKYSLMSGLATVGAYETDPSGARITVTLQTITRHQHLCWGKPCDLSSMSPPP